MTPHPDRLKRLVARWARRIAGEPSIPPADRRQALAVAISTSLSLIDREVQRIAAITASIRTAP